MKAAQDLAARAAAAADRFFVADYSWDRGKGDPVTVRVSLAADGTWRIDVPGGAQGGQSDVSVAWNRQGYYQCSGGATVVCVDISTPDGTVPAEYDPVVQHLFTDWVDEWRDRALPVSVAYAEPLKGSGKDAQCFSLEHNAVAVAVAMPAGVYCLRDDGLITAARSGFGTLKLTSRPQAPEPHISLPGDISDEEPLSTSPPPKPTPKPTKGEKKGKEKPDA